MITPRHVAGLAILVLAAHAQAGPTMMTARAFRMGQWRTAAESLRDSLERSPEDSELLARLGLAYYQLGLYSDAELAFRDAEGSEYYERVGIGAHASTLRELGRAEEAAPLRQAQIIAAESDSALNSAYLGAADDALARGDLDEALEQATWGLSVRPASPSAHAWLADIHHQRGELDDMGFHLWMIDLIDYDSSRACELEARIALDEGAVVEALHLLENTRSSHRRNGPLALLHAEAYRSIGWLVDAEGVFDLRFVLFGERREYLVERGMLHIAMGEHGEGCAMLQRSMAIYPQHREAEGLMARHGCAGSSQP